MESNREFREVFTHDAVKSLVEDVLATHGSKVGAKIIDHRYNSSNPHGSILVGVEKTHAQQTIRYGLPDDRDEIRSMTLAALEPVEEWKSQHRREW